MSLPSTALAMVATEPYAMEPAELPLPPVGPDDGLLLVEASAICGTDWEIWGREFRGGGLGPLILGHENVGRVAALGEQAARRWGVAEGDRVAVEEFLPCGTCRTCRGGNYRICPATDSRGRAPFLRYGSTPLTVSPALYGGQAEYLYLHPRAILYPIGEHLDAELAALFVPLGNGVRWVSHEGALRIGETAVVIGPGQHGLGCVVAAKEAGAGRVIVLGAERDAGRLALAAELGADHVLAAPADPVAAVLELTDGQGADLVVDLAPGAVSSVVDAIGMAGKRARVLLAASKHGRPVQGFPHDQVVRREVLLRGVRGHDQRSVEPAIEIIRSGRYPLARMCTHRFGLERAADALHTAAPGGQSGAIHVSVVPQHDVTVR